MNYLAIAQEQFLKDYNLKVFPKDKLWIQNATNFPPTAMNYLNGKPFLSFVYFGETLFISTNEKIKTFITSYAKKCEKELYRVFDAPNVMNLNNELEKHGYTIAHLAQYFIPSTEPVKQIELPYTVKLYRNKEIEELYSHEFSMALCGSVTAKRRDVLAVSCSIQNKIVGVAGCTNDSDTMWQIGVDVLEGYRRKGIATALVLKLKEEIISLGKCPFYCCAWSNLASKRLARATGFVDGWVELTAKPINEDWIREIRTIK